MERRVESLGDAQKELVMAQYATYKRNRERMAKLQDKIAVIDAGSYHTMDEMRIKQAERSTMAYEYAQLATANSRISAELFGFLGEENG